MAVDPIENLHLSFLQDVLPVGMAVVERARQGGAGKVVEVFTSTSEPLDALRIEGEPSARLFRDRLDKISPGLGNPVVSVDVAVETTTPQSSETFDHTSLMDCLDRIQFDMKELEHLILNDSSEQSISKSEKF